MIQPSIKTARLEVRGNLRKFFNGMKDTEIILDGPAGTGKTRVLLERQHLIQCKYQRSRGLILRKFRSSMNETCLEVLDNEVFCDSDGVKYPDAPDWHERDQKYVYPNGSEIIVAGMDDPSKVMSSKYDWFYWNEAIEAKREEWEAVMSRLRNFKVPYQQALGDTNPGPPSHWIKRMSEEGSLILMPTTHKDNPVYWDQQHSRWTAKGEAYVNRILRDGLTGLRKDRLYDGKWKMAEGQVYDMWDPEIHVIPRLPHIPSHWLVYWTFDFGFQDPTVWQEILEDPENGNIYLHRELYHSQLRVEQVAQRIKQAGIWRYPLALICDHDSENRATLEKELQMLTLNAYKAIHPGVQAVQKRLTVDPKTERPHLFIEEQANIKTDKILRDRHKPTCTQDEFDCYVWDTAKMGMDKYKDEPVDKDNHGMDALRYGVAFIDDIATDPQQYEQVINYNDTFDDDEEQIKHYFDTMISPF